MTDLSGGPIATEESIALNVGVDDVLFKPGDVIQQLHCPFVKVINDSHKGRRCDFCFEKSAGLRRCSGCYLMHYCNRQCQKKDWKEAHSLECKVLPTINAKTAATATEFNFKLLRLYAMLKLHPEREIVQHKLYDGTQRTFQNLLAHEDKISNIGAEFDSIRTLAKVILNSSRDLMDTSADYIIVAADLVKRLLRLAGVWKINATVMLSERQTETIASGIYIEGSSFDHSCRPTAVPNLRGFQLEVRAIHTIRKGERPMVSYLAGHRPRQERQVILLSRYHFECKCDLCQEEMKKDSMDYRKLESLKATPSIVTWQTILSSGLEELKLMRACYVKYDERISNKMPVLFEEVASLAAPKTILRNLAKETEEHLKITFGPDSDDLVRFDKLKKEYGIK